MRSPVKLSMRDLLKHPHLKERLLGLDDEERPQPQPPKPPKPTPSKTSPGKFPLTDRMEIAVFWFVLGMVTMSGMVAYVRVM